MFCSSTNIRMLAFYIHKMMLFIIRKLFVILLIDSTSHEINLYYSSIFIYKTISNIERIVYQK